MHIYISGASGGVAAVSASAAAEIQQLLAKIKAGEAEGRSEHLVAAAFTQVKP